MGSARPTHDLTDGPAPVSPPASDPPQDPDDVTVTRKRVPPPNGGPIIGSQVLVVQPETGITTLPTITLDVTMPPGATSTRIPPGFLRPGTEDAWEVLAIERGGDQTLSPDTFTPAP